ncbi:TatD family hydrolase [[Eubacterium] cellulosolvens]
MIDCHCHLEQSDYARDRETIVEKCRRDLNAVITSCGHPKDLDLTLDLVNRFNRFVFATAAIHPQYAKKFSEMEIKSFIDNIKKNRRNIVGVGETGLDYYWIKEAKEREVQKKLFIQFISLSQELRLPLIIHSREAYEETLKVLEQEDPYQVVMHMFGANQLTKKIIENDWYVSMNAIVLKSKKHKKVVRDMPLKRLLLETDAPWLAPEDFESTRNDSTAVKYVAGRIAEIKKIDIEEVDKVTSKNAIQLFRLDV